MNPLPPLAPWQQRAFEQACAAITGGHFGHATLIVGPAQKAGPSAASTTARTAASSPSRAKASVSSAMTSSLKALRTSGRFIVTVATWPCTSTRMAVLMSGLPPAADRPDRVRGRAGQAR